MIAMRDWRRKVFLGLFGIVGLFFLLWSLAKIHQWAFRQRAERLIAETKSIHLGQSMNSIEADLRTRWEITETNCADKNQSECSVAIREFNRLPEFITGSDADEGSHSLLRVVNAVGLRSSMVGLFIKSKNGFVSSIAYDETVALPVDEWFSREGAYVPELAVDSSIVQQFSSLRSSYVQPEHPYRFARRFKGPWGLEVEFVPQESEEKKKQLMDFNFSCITQFRPCHNESEILEYGAMLLKEDDEFSTKSPQKN